MPGDLHWIAIFPEDICTCSQNPSRVRLMFELQIASDASQFIKRSATNVRPFRKKYTVGYRHDGAFGNELAHERTGLSEDKARCFNPPSAAHVSRTLSIGRLLFLVDLRCLFLRNGSTFD